MLITIKNLLKYPIRVITNHQTGTCLALRQYEVSPLLNVDDETFQKLSHDHRVMIMSAS